MGFGGSVSAMLTSLKNNRRSRVSTLEKLKGYENIKYKKGKIEKKATPLQLKKIRDRLQEENKRTQRIKNVFVIGLVLLATILFIIFNFVKF